MNKAYLCNRLQSAYLNKASHNFMANGDKRTDSNFSNRIFLSSLSAGWHEETSGVGLSAIFDAPDSGAGRVAVGVEARAAPGLL